MRALVAIVIVMLVIALLASAMLTFVMFRDVAASRARAEGEAQRGNELSMALDRVLVENEELRQANSELQDENTELQQQVAVLGRDPDFVNPEAQTIPAQERVIPMVGAVLDNGRSDQMDYIEWVFDWPDVPGATRYNLYVIGGRATIPAIDAETEESAYVHLALSSYISDSNRLGWTWKVRTLVDGEWSEWSGVRTFDVETLDSGAPVD